MAGFILKYPVQTIDNTVVLPAGTELSEDVMEEVRSSGNAQKFTASKILEFGTIKKDICEFISVPPYDFIFSDKDRTQAMIDSMDEVHVITPLLESFEYFQQNDEYTYRHMLLVFALSMQLGRELISDRRVFHECAMAAPAHDFGKNCIPVNILKKSNALSSAERNMIEHHTIAGYVLLQYYLGESGSLSSFVARDHHETINGTGYPAGIKLCNLPIEIVAVSDVYDALISQRPYRPVSYDNRTAMEEITARAERGEFNWNVVKALVSCNRKTRTHFSQCQIATKKRGIPPSGNNYGLLGPDESN